MGYLEGLLGGFAQRKSEVEAQNLNEAHAANQREGALYNALLQSPDPEIKAMAMTGLLTSAGPQKRQSGLRGWMGEMQANPALEGIRQLINTPVTEQQPIHGPTAVPGYIPQAPSAAASAAMPTGSPVTPGSPPIQALTPAPRPMSTAPPSFQGVAQGLAPEVRQSTADPAALAAGAAATPPIGLNRPAIPAEQAATAGLPPDVRQPYGPGPVIGQQTVTHPRQIFDTPEQQYVAQAKAKGEGDFLGIVAAQEAGGVPHETAVQNALRWQEEEHMRRMGLGSTAIRYGGVMKGNQAGPGEKDVYGRALDPEQDYRVEIQPSGARDLYPTQGRAPLSLGAKANQFLPFLGGKVDTPEKAAQLQQMLTASKNAMTWREAADLASSMNPNESNEWKVALANVFMEQTAAPPLTAPGVGTPPSNPGAPVTAPTTPPSVPTAASPAAPPAQTPPAPSQAGGAPTPVVAPTGGAAAGPAGARTPPTAAAPTPAPGLNTGGIGGAPKAGTLNVQLPAEMGGATKESGKPLAPSLQLALAKAKTVNDSIDQALAQLKDYKDDNTLQGAINLTRNYRGGYSSVESAVAQLTDLASLQQSSNASLTTGAPRSMLYADLRRQHVPRLPSSLQIQAADYTPLGAEGTQAVSRTLMGLRGQEGGYDTPKQWYDKLQQAKKNNDNFIREVQSGAAAPTTAPAAGGPPPGRGGASAAGPGADWQMINGVLHHNGQPVP